MMIADWGGVLLTSEAIKIKSKSKSKKAEERETAVGALELGGVDGSWVELTRVSGLWRATELQ